MGIQIPRFLDELREFVRFPSVSLDPRHAQSVRDCASWLAAATRRAGLPNSWVVQTAGNPIVFAERRGAVGRPTVLFYGHYDVQPAEPVQEWKTPPFSLTVQASRVYGRGSSDDKGPVLIFLKALESYLKTRGELPVNVLCLFEGEEEIGSPNLTAFLKQNARRLAADVAVLSDTKMLSPRKPAITYSERGALSLELQVSGPPTELHSGSFGGAVHNPIHALCDLIASLHGTDSRIAIPGFYATVRASNLEERRSMALAGPSDANIMQEVGPVIPWGEAGYSLYERTTLRPALSVSGIAGGHQGPGVKSVIPPRALAKINFRLVPDQDPYEIEQLVRSHIRARTPPTVRSAVRTVFRAKPAVMDLRHPSMRAAARAYRHGFGVSPVFLRSGGTIPIVATLMDLLNIPTVLMGFSLPADRIHASNESFYLPTVPRAVATVGSFLDQVGRLAQPTLIEASA